MRGMIVVIVILTGLMMPSAAVLAADSTKAEIPMMTPGAPPEMKQVAILEGTWDAAMQMRMGPETPWIEAKTVCTYKMVLDGCALEQTCTGETAGMPVKGTGLTCFNRGSGKWQTSWADNMAAALSLYEGDFEDGRMVVSGVDKLPGMTLMSRITTFNITPTRFESLVENSFDNGATWIETMKGVFTKR